MNGKIPPAGTPVLGRDASTFSKFWYDFLWDLARSINAIPSGGIPPGSLTVSQSDVVLGRSSPGAGAVEELTFTDQAQQLADDTTFEEMRNTLGLSIGEDVQEFSDNLQEIADLELVQGDILYRDSEGLQRLPIGAADQVLAVNAGATAPEWVAAAPVGRWEPLTNGDHTSPELIFVDGDVVMVFVS